MLIGLILGVLAIRSSLKGPTTVALTTPLAVLTIPFLDSLAAIMRRRLTGRSIYSTDRGHLHHCLLRSGLTHRRMLLCVALLCAATGFGAWISVYLQNELFALISTVAVVGILVVTRVFGYAELSLLASKLTAFTGSLVPRKRRGAHRESTVRLQGTRNWSEVWDTLTDFADRNDLCSLKLDLNVAWLHEGYHATWERRQMPDLSEMWFTRLPIVTRDRTIGRLEVAGLLAKDSMYMVLSILAEMLDSLEPAFEQLAFDGHAAEVLEERVEAAATRRPAPHRAAAHVMGQEVATASAHRELS